MSTTSVARFKNYFKDSNRALVPMNTSVLARAIRRNAVEMVHRARASHIGACLSIADMLAVLYGEVLHVRADRPDDPDRDRFILSKGHAAAALYAALAEVGFFSRSWLESYGQDGSPLAGHVAHHGVPGVEFSTGSLGHGLPVGCGIALASKRKGRPFRTFVLLGDGECDEGAIWEAALFASHHQLDGLTVLIDHNKYQGLGRVEDVLGLGDLREKWCAFGWAAKEVDGHDHHALRSCLHSLPFEPAKPSVVIAHTVKGKGVSFMEDELIWHYRSPSDEELAQALREVSAP